MNQDELLIELQAIRTTLEEQKSVLDATYLQQSGTQKQEILLAPDAKLIVTYDVRFGELLVAALLTTLILFVATSWLHKIILGRRK